MGEGWVMVAALVATDVNKQLFRAEPATAARFGRCFQSRALSISGISSSSSPLSSIPDLGRIETSRT